MSLTNSLSTNAQSIKNNKLLELVTYVLKTKHLQPVDLDDSFSKSVFNDYIKLLDPLKHYFLLSDIKDLKQYEYKIDDQIKNNDLSFFNISYNKVLKRMKESYQYIEEIHKTSNDFNLKETIKNDPDDFGFATNELELKEILRKRYKYYFFELAFQNLESEIQKSEIDKKYTSKTLEQIDLELRKKSSERMAFTYDNPSNLSESYFFSLFMNSIIMQFDPHSIYIKPDKRDRYKFDVLGKFIGFGITFGMVNNQIVATKFLQNSPAERDKKLIVGDVFLKVTNGNKTTDLVGVDFNFLLKILGEFKVGTEVNFTIKKSNGSVKLVSAKKEAFELDDSFIKSSIIKKEKETFGIIKIPKFYEDEEDQNGKNVFKDVVNEIITLKESKIKGLIIDLRDNKIGAISMATKLASLFLKRGSMAQMKSLDKEKVVFSYSEINSVWDGPLVLLTNKNSTFAAEIFTSTIQDYNRGIVVGDEKTFGKGTVQEILDLNLFNDKKLKADYGSLWITTKKSYRITGKTVQIKGVLSDVVLPDENMFKVSIENIFKEREAKIDELTKSSIPEDKTESLKFEPYVENNFFEIISKSK